MFSRLGVRGRLLVSFFGISAFAVIAAATAMYSFLEVGKALERIIEFRVPSVTASLQLSRQAERVVAAAPALLTVTTAAEHERVSDMISAEVDRLDSLLSELELRGTDPIYVEDGRRGVQDLRANLDRLHGLITERLATTDRKAALLHRLDETHRDTQRLLGPGLLLVESSLLRLGGAMADADPKARERSELITRLVDSLAAAPPLQRAQIEELSITGTLLQAATAERPTELPLLALPVERSLDALAKLAQDLQPDLRSSLLAQAQEFRGFVSGPDSIVETRRRELELIAERLATGSRKTALLHRLDETHRDTQRLLGPGLLLVESSLSRLRGAVVHEDLNANERSELITRLIDSLAVAPALQQAQIEERSIVSALLQAATAEHLTELPLLAIPLERSLDALETRPRPAARSQVVTAGPGAGVSGLRLGPGQYPRNAPARARPNRRATCHRQPPDGAAAPIGSNPSGHRAPAGTGASAGRGESLAPTRGDRQRKFRREGTQGAHSGSSQLPRRLAAVPAGAD
jgi:hypothetical protein